MRCKFELHNYEISAITEFLAFNREQEPISTSFYPPAHHVETFNDLQNALYGSSIFGIRPDGHAILRGKRDACLAYGLDHIWASIKQSQFKDSQNICTRSVVPIITKYEFQDLDWSIIDQWSWDIQHPIQILPVTPFRSQEHAYLRFMPCIDLTYLYGRHTPGLTNSELALFSKVLDLYVGIPWVLLDQDPLSIKWANDLLPASKFSYQDYTITKNNYKIQKIEYIPAIIPASATFHPTLTWLMTGLCREAVAIALIAAKQPKMLKTITKISTPDIVRDVINNHDLEGAIDIWSRLRTFGLYHGYGYHFDNVWFRGYAGHELDNQYRTHHTENKRYNSVVAFEQLVLDGGWSAMGPSTFNNWRLDLNSGNFVSHANSLMAWETWVKIKSKQTLNPRKNNLLGCATQIKENAAKCLASLI